MSALDIFLHLASPVILVCLTVIFLRKKLHKEFPFFFAYMLSAPVSDALRALVRHPRGYFWLYWTTEAIYGALALLVLREVFRRLFAVSYISFRWFRFLLPTTVLFILAFTVWETLYHPLHPGSLPEIVSVIYWFDLGVHLLEGIILLLILLLTLGFPLSWRRHEFGILAGFGLNASVTIVAYLFRFQLGGTYEMFFRYGPPMAFLLASVVWLHAFLGSPNSRQKPRIGLDEAQAELRQGKEALAFLKKLLRWRRQILDSPV